MLFHLFLLALVLQATAQNDSSPSNATDYLNNVTEALQSAGLTSLAGVAPRLNNTSFGQAVLGRLTEGGNYTLFAPTNGAFDSAPDELANNDELLARVLSYHIISGDFAADNGSLTSATLPNVTIGRTLLNDSGVVQLEGGKSQVLAWSRIGENVTILNQATNVTVNSSAEVANLLVNSIDGLLAYPTNISTTLQVRNLTTLSGLFNTTNVTDSSGNNVSLANTFDTQLRGFTLFAPNEEALQQASSQLESVANNNTAIVALFQNHLINGSTVYSPSLTPDANATTALGQVLSFSSNSSGTYVRSSASGNVVATARIVTSDVLVQNGVLHIIDRALFNLDNDPSAASSAYNSATSAAGASTTESGPVGTPTSTSANAESEAVDGALGLLGATVTVKALISAMVGVSGWMALGIAII